MTPWIYTTWQSPSITTSSSNGASTTPLPVLGRVPLEIYTRIIDCLDPINSPDDQTVLARCMRVFKPYSNFTAARLYRYLDTRWMDTEGNNNPFHVTFQNDPELFVEIGIRKKRPEAEVNKIRQLIGQNTTPLPRPLPQHLTLCRYLVLTNVDETILHVLTKVIKTLDVMHIPLTSVHAELHQHFLNSGDPQSLVQPLSRSLEYANNLNAPVLVLDGDRSKVLAQHVETFVTKTSTLGKSLRKIIVRCGRWESDPDYNPIKLPYIRRAPPKDLETVVILYLPDLSEEPNLFRQCQYNAEGIAECLAAEFLRKSHKKDPEYLFVGIEYASPPFFDFEPIDLDLSTKMEKMVSSAVKEKAASSNKKQDAIGRLDKWRFVSLRDYAKTLKGLERNIIPPEHWANLDQNAQYQLNGKGQKVGKQPGVFALGGSTA